MSLSPSTEVGPERLLDGRYRPLRELAVGGMATIWSARDETTGRTVAIKVLSAHLARDPAAVERFRREGVTAASLSHPRIADVLDFIDDDGTQAMVMELVSGESLATRLARTSRLAVDDAVRIAGEVLEALATAHAAGIVHRDIKPGNIMLDEQGHVKVTDFGIARAVGDASLTMTGVLMGTPHYLSPEQLRGEPATPRSDLYSLGVVLYEMLTGVRPFGGDTAASAAIARLATDPEPLRHHRADVPASVERVVMRSLSRSPDDRYAEAAGMRAALVAAIERPDDATLPMPDESTVRIMRPADARSARVRARAVPPPWWLRLVGRVMAPAVLLAILAGMLVPAALGTPAVAVPSFVGMSLERARDAARDLAIELTVRRAAGLPPRDRIVSQAPRASTEVARGSAVRVVVSAGNLRRVPGVIGRSLEDAIEALERAGLRLGPVNVRVTGAVGSGTVLEQGVTGTARAGSPVGLVVAESPDEPAESNGKGEGKGKGRGKHHDEDEDD